jgi:hypothetical protein
MQSQRPQLPAAWVDRIFDRLKAVYGSSRVGGMFADADADEVRRAWGDALGRFEAATLGAVLQSLADRDSPFPPSLPEFAGLCRAVESRPGHRVALGMPDRNADEIERGRARMDELRGLLAGAAARLTGKGSKTAASAPPSACRCYHGMRRSDELCEACSAFARNRVAVERMREASE